MRLWMLALLLPGLAFAADIPIKGDCAVGKSQAAHGLTAADAQARIIQYARQYVQNYSSYNNEKRDARRRASDYLELKAWTMNHLSNTSASSDQRR